MYAKDRNRIRVCSECKHYQSTGLFARDIRPYIGKGFSIDELIKRASCDAPIPVYDCPYANDWCRAEYEANTLCDNRFEQ